MAETISDEFRSRLDSLEPDTNVKVIITAKLSDDLEAKLKEELKDVPKGSTDPEMKKKRVEVSKRYHEEGMQPVLDYLDGKGAEYGTAPILKTIFTTLPVSDIYELSEQLYVATIFEDQKVHLIDPVDKRPGKEELLKKD